MACAGMLEVVCSFIIRQKTLAFFNLPLYDIMSYCQETFLKLANRIHHCTSKSTVVSVGNQKTIPPPTPPKHM